jgi:prepilin-type N-terminal cleavage/methylation domain-containing protein
MKTLYPSECGSRGFTLIELIVTIVIGATMASMLFAFSSTFFKTSAQQVASIESNMAFFQVMENMVSDYKYQLATAAAPLTTFSANVTSYSTSTTPPNYGQTYTLVGGTPCYAKNTNGTIACSGTTTNILMVQIQIPNGPMTLTALFTQ